MADKDKKDDGKKDDNKNSSGTKEKYRHGSDGKVSLPGQQNRRWT